MSQSCDAHSGPSGLKSSPTADRDLWRAGPSRREAVSPRPPERSRIRQNAPGRAVTQTTMDPRTVTTVRQRHDERATRSEHAHQRPHGSPRLSTRTRVSAASSTRTSVCGTRWKDTGKAPRGRPGRRPSTRRDPIVASSQYVSVSKGGGEFGDVPGAEDELG